MNRIADDQTIGCRKDSAGESFERETNGWA